MEKQGIGLRTCKSCYELWTALRSKESSTQPTSSLEKQRDGRMLRETKW
jgi:hypothetical protein